MGNCSSSIEVKEHPTIQKLILTDVQLKEINNRFLSEIEKGLSKQTHADADVKCFVTYVQDLPTGNETGKFLALDLGGTNFRVLLITLKGQQDFEMESKIFEIPANIFTGPGDQLFDHIAQCLADFAKEKSVNDEVLPLGFTFSFPLTQLGLCKGSLVKWTKGFTCDGVVGRDVVTLLKEAIARRNDVKISVTAILNDTTGTLMSCAHKNPNCRIGCIVGTGSNACYVEKIKNAELYDGPRNNEHVIINTEWGAFGDNGSLDFIRTEFDQDVDENSLNPGKQIHEKMISGMYMGELVRLAIQKMIKEGAMFNGKGSQQFSTRYSFLTKYVSNIEADAIGSYTNCLKVLNKMGIEKATEKDCANIRFICECVSKRAAYLCGSALAVLLNKMDEPSVTIGVDGTVFRLHPHFKDHMNKKIRDLTKSHIEFSLMLSEDGSGRGAALVAAVAVSSDESEK